MTSVKTFHEQLLVPLTSSFKSHRIVQLPNGLLVLLISDPTEDLASVAISVSAGAHNDPVDIPGLAHFCEHLLLLGSKNFPNPNEFHNCLTKNGGRRNAFTTGENTCYFFEIPSSSTHKVNNLEEPVFNHLIKIFADSFKNPNFNESMFEKEIYAIDNEHTANKSSSGRLLYHGARLISNPNHPFHRFATGNFFTLNDLPRIKKLKVRNQLMDYFKNNYIAENMTLVIRSSQSLNILNKLVLQNFSDLPSSSDNKKSKTKLFSRSSNNKEISKNTVQELVDIDVSSNWTYDTKAFTQFETSNCILINSSNNPILRVIFPFDEQDIPNTDLYARCWSNIVGDEGEGSLDSFLKDRGYSVGLNAFSQYLSKNSSILVLEISLTNTGIKSICLIISTIFANYIPAVFGDVKELSRVLYEFESIDLLSYIHQDASKSAMDESSKYAQNLGSNLRALKPKNILKGSSNWDSQFNLGTEKGNLFWYDKSEHMFNFVKRTFALKNLRITVLGDSKLLKKSMDAMIFEIKEDEDEYFNLDYTMARFDCTKLPPTQEKVSFNIIKTNVFIPSYALDHLQLQNRLLDYSNKSSEASLSFVTKTSLSSTTARLHSKSSHYEIWTKLETSHIFSSKQFISLDIISPNLEPCPENTMMTEIFTELLKFKISKNLYCAELVDYTWEIQASLKGDVRFGFTLSGYAAGVETLLDLIADEFQNIYQDTSFTMDEFRKSRVTVRSRYNELEQNNSLGMAISGLLVVLEENMWTLEDRLDALDDIDINSFRSFLDEFQAKDKFTKLLIQGDFKEIDSINKSINKLTHHLDHHDKLLVFIEPSTHSIGPGKSYKIERKGAKNDPMNSISYFIETGPRNDIYIENMTKLFSYLMSLTLVPDLRFKKQLGYAVLGGTRIMRSTYGIHVSIMSGNFTPQYLENKINEYLSDWENTYSMMSDSEFQTTVIDQYLKNFKIDLTKSGGPESLTAEIPASASSYNALNPGQSLKIHKLLWDQISTRSYNYGEVDSEKFFSTVTKSDFLKFFRAKISSKSNTRSQLSIMIESQLSSEETQQQLIQLQLEAFLKMNGLRISSDKLKGIVENANGNPVYLLKDLFKYFSSQGASFKLCTVVLKEVVKQVSENVKRYKINDAQARAFENSIVSEKIESIEQFHNQSTIYYIGQSL